MSKRMNHKQPALIFAERGGMASDGACKEIAALYFVGANSRKQGIAYLKAKFGQHKTFFMRNGYGNDRRTELDTLPTLLLKPGEIMNWKDPVVVAARRKYYRSEYIKERGNLPIHHYQMPNPTSAFGQLVNQDLDYAQI